MDAGLLQSLVVKLGPLCRRSLEAAVGLAVTQGHFNVEVEHWLLSLLEIDDSDLAILVDDSGADRVRLQQDLRRTLAGLRGGSSRAPGFSPDLVKLAREAWVVASLKHDALRVRSVHLLEALLADPGLRAVAQRASEEVARLSPEGVASHLSGLDARSGEVGAAETPVKRKPADGATAIARFTTDLTALAREGRLDPVIGRDREIRQLVDILTRRRQNNPILTGEAGVGKTAVVEGLALAIVAGDVPPALGGTRLLALDLGLLQAGAGMKGEFEQRLKDLIAEIQGASTPVTLFIDEAHMLIGAGAAPGQGDAANLLKPLLARGELRTIAATTWGEYKKYIERDPALTRRFQVVKVEEPCDATAVDMLRGLQGSLERHHGVQILSGALDEAVRLARRYLPSRQLPDKAISLLDTACARVAMSRSVSPEPLLGLRRELAAIEARLAAAQREAAVGLEPPTDMAGLWAAREDIARQLAGLDARWRAERDLAERVLAGRVRLAETADAEEHARRRATQAGLEAELAALQGEMPLLRIAVDGQAVAEVASAWTGIPLGRMLRDEIRSVLSLREALAVRVVGQPHALDAIARTIWTSRAKLTDPRKPLGVFLMVGTSGTGKTETALALADQIYGGEQALTVITMSEFKEEHKVSTLTGSPPGYVGYGEGGLLTEAARRRPHSVLLLDEMEKAHPGVQDVFYQLFDKGSLRDGEGRDVDFRNMVVIMTANVGSELISRLWEEADPPPDVDRLAELLLPELTKVFKPAFLGRVTVVPYLPLDAATIGRIISLQLDRVAARYRAVYQTELSWSPEVFHLIEARCRTRDSGARGVEQMLTQELLPALSGALLERLASGGVAGGIKISVRSDRFHIAFV
ncbi:type VI secretion system ATPase TssH [Chelatococcus sp. GCM10030263]|uniref:type VI secretion system ATPase TssH n=1 Tax=Chelatococcus sp. GCM10030263 TaxID=3273387 RepID=UPI00360A73DE